ncbi:hypothetical protein D8820_06445 [Streptococcus sanguinis]|nr:hypothetical protein D8820_06445 [Streptococcus sanguinis]
MGCHFLLLSLTESITSILDEVFRILNKERIVPVESLTIGIIYCSVLNLKIEITIPTPLLPSSVPEIIKETLHF